MSPTSAFQALRGDAPLVSGKQKLNVLGLTCHVTVVGESAQSHPWFWSAGAVSLISAEFKAITESSR